MKRPVEFSISILSYSIILSETVYSYILCDDLCTWPDVGWSQSVLLHERRVKPLVCFSAHSSQRHRFFLRTLSFLRVWTHLTLCELV